MPTQNKTLVTTQAFKGRHNRADAFPTALLLRWPESSDQWMYARSCRCPCPNELGNCYYIIPRKKITGLKNLDLLKVREIAFLVDTYFIKNLSSQSLLHPPPPCLLVHSNLKCYFSGNG